MEEIFGFDWYADAGRLVLVLVHCYWYTGNGTGIGTVLLELVHWYWYWYTGIGTLEAAPFCTTVLLERRVCLATPDFWANR